MHDMHDLILATSKQLITALEKADSGSTAAYVVVLFVLK
jgi:hypothetical protein